MYALVDCNNFYCSCERLFNPKLRDRPVVVLSNNDGCVISRSEEAKAIGIRMGTPAFMAEKFFTKHRVAIFSSNYSLYGDISERVMQTLAEFVPRLEIYSIDEAFLDMHDLRYCDLFELGVRIRAVILQATGIPVSVGIAPTKTLAKMANKYAKKNCKQVGVFWAASDKLIHDMLAYTLVADIWGVGPQYAKLLAGNGFKNALELRAASDDWIRAHMTVVGERLLNELRGKPSVEWEFEAPAKKNICTARGFGELITSKHELAEALSSYTANCAVKLRDQKSCTSRIEVFVETNAFRKEDRQYFRTITVTLPVSTSNTAQLIKYALACLDIIFKAGYNYHKTGITVMDLIPEGQVQYGLYDARESPKQKTVMDILDELNHSFGKDTVRFAAQGYNKKWKLKQAMLSPKYTTRIGDILRVKN